MCSYKLFGIIIALMTVNDFGYKAIAVRTINDNGQEIILAREKEKVYMDCKKYPPEKFCGFVLPDRKTLYTAKMSSKGLCSISINPVLKDAGIWDCIIGTKVEDAEVMKTYEIKVVGQYAAVRSNVSVVHTTPFTLHCVITRGTKPLSFCRFTLPKSEPFTINSNATESTPHLYRYYFPNNKSLERGDCAVTIRGATYSDGGTWTCGAGFDGREYTDNIHVEVEGLYTLTQRDIIIGILCLIPLGVVIAYYALRNTEQDALARTVRRRNEAIESHQLEQLPTSSHSGKRLVIPKITIEPPSDVSED